MGKSKEKIQKLLNYILIALAVLVAIPLVYLLSLNLKLPIPYIQISTLHKWIVFNGELLLVLFLYKIYSKDGWKYSNNIYFIRDLFVANCLFAYPFITFYTSRMQDVVPAIRTLRPYLLLGYKTILIVTLLLTVYSISYVNRFRRWLVTGLESQRIKDDEAATGRITHYVEKHPKLATAPIIGTIAVKMSGEGFEYAFALLILAAIGLVLRLWYLDALPPATDETFHLVTAKEIFQGLPLNQVSYQRSLYTVTLPVVISFKVFGMSLWSARFAGVLVNILSLFPLYLLGRKINKPVALIAAGLFVFSPWMISISRNVREYAYYAFFFYLTAYLMLKAYESIPDQLDSTSNIRTLFTWKNIFYRVILYSILYFVVVIDQLSTFKTILILFPVFGLLSLKKADWRRPANFLPVLFLFLIEEGIFLGMLLLSAGGETIQINRQFNERFLYLFFDHPPQQWYYNRPLIAFSLLTLAILATYFWDRKKFILPFIVLTYTASHFAFALFKFGADRTRYAINNEFWHILLMAVGLFLLLFIVEKFIKNKYKYLAWLVVLLYFWNIPQSFVASTYIAPGTHPITAENHVDIAPAYYFIKNNIREDEVLVTTTYIYRYSQWSGGIRTNNVIYYTYDEKDSEKVIFDAIETHPCGMIALDYPRGLLYARPVPLVSFSHAGKQVDFMGWFGGVYILRWCNR
jgi:hypothetical protein